MSDLSLLWLPSGKYDSVKPLWQEGYIWNPLPVDNTLPLHQTSFLDINEKEAASATRSRATTLKSRASTQTLPCDMRQGSISRRPGQEEADQSDPDTISSLDGGNARERRVSRTRRQTARQTNPNAEPTKPTKPSRLHSFHLGDTVQGEPEAKGAIPTVARSRRKPKPEVHQRPDVPSDGRLSKDTPPLGKNEASGDMQVVRTSSSVSRRRRNSGAVRRNSTTQSLGGETQVDVDLPVIREEPTPPAPMRGSSQHVSSPEGGGSKCIGVKLDMNLEIEVQLKVKLQGDLTLTLFN
jgi:hypothetical protein